MNDGASTGGDGGAAPPPPPPPVRPTKRSRQSTDASSVSSGGSSGPTLDCPICLEPWTASGAHQICSIECGHLFGLACIEQWIAARKQQAACPQCNTKVKRRDVRKLFLPNIGVVDTSRADELAKKMTVQTHALDKVRFRPIDPSHTLNTLLCAQATKEIQSLHVALAVQRGETSNLQKALSQARAELQALKSHGFARAVAPPPAVAAAPAPTAPAAPTAPTADTHIPSTPPVPVKPPAGMPLPLPTSSPISSQSLVPVSVLNLSDARVIEWASYDNKLFVTDRTGQTTYGVWEICVEDPRPSRSVSFPVHSKAIRDLKFQAGPATMCHRIATVALDSTMKVTNTSARATEVTFSLAQSAWSCAWHPQDPMLLFAGFPNGTVQLFDLRNTRTHIQTWQADQAPIVSLCAAGDTLLACTPRGLFNAAFTPSSLQFFQPVTTPALPPFTYASYLPAIRAMLVNTRGPVGSPLGDSTCKSSTCLLQPASAAQDGKADCAPPILPTTSWKFSARAWGHSNSAVLSRPTAFFSTPLPEEPATAHPGRYCEFDSARISPPAGSVLYLAAGDDLTSRVWIWNLSTRIAYKLQPHPSPVLQTCVVPSPAGDVLASVSSQRLVLERLHSVSASQSS